MRKFMEEFRKFWKTLAELEDELDYGFGGEDTVKLFEIYLKYKENNKIEL